MVSLHFLQFDPTYPAPILDFFADDIVYEVPLRERETDRQTDRDKETPKIRPCLFHAAISPRAGADLVPCSMHAGDESLAR